MKKKAIIEDSKNTSEKKRMKDFYRSDGKQKAYEASANSRAKKQKTE
jgi:hypothetical protein